MSDGTQERKIPQMVQSTAPEIFRSYFLYLLFARLDHFQVAGVRYAEFLIQTKNPFRTESVGRSQLVLLKVVLQSFLVESNHRLGYERPGLRWPLRDHS